MLAYTLRRLLLAVPTLLGIALVAFGMLKLAPGGAEYARFAEQVSESGAPLDDAAFVEEQLRRFREEWLLDRSLARQFLHYVGPFDLGAEGHRWFGGTGADPWHGLLAGELGTEMLRPDVRVGEEMLRRLKVTVPLAGTSILLTYLLAVPLGVWTAVRRGRPLELATTALLFVLYAVPIFWACLLLQYAFGRTGLDWLPVIGLRDPDADELSAAGRALDLARHAVLPVAAYTYAGLAYVARQTRASVLEHVERDYVRAARARGLPERVVVARHVLRNALIPIVTLTASILPALIGGSVVVEYVFDVPGMGSWAFDALLKRDVNVLMATTLVSGALTVLGILLSDLLYAAVDPRIRLE